MRAPLLSLLVAAIVGSLCTANEAPTASDGSIAIAHQPCQHIVMIGDSNTRGIFSALEQLVRRNSTAATHWPTRQTAHAVAARLCGAAEPACSKGVEMQSDADVLVQRVDNCVLLSLRFVHGAPQELSSGAALLTRRCFFDGRVPCASTFAAPHVATQAPTVFVAHGLWGAELRHVHGERCHDIFPPRELRALAQLQASAVDLWWVTNFALRHHTRISNAMLAREYACQLELAQQRRWRVVDLFKLVRARVLAVPRDFHLSAHSFRVVATELARRTNVQ